MTPEMLCRYDKVAPAASVVRSSSDEPSMRLTAAPPDIRGVAVLIALQQPDAEPTTQRQGLAVLEPAQVCPELQTEGQPLAHLDGCGGQGIRRRWSPRRGPSRLQA